jgi:hypothetical protein
MEARLGEWHLRTNDGTPPAEQILSILLNRRVNHNRKGDFSYTDRIALTGRLADEMRHDRPLEFVIVGFHTKIPSLLATPAAQPDFGEFAMIRHFRRIHEHIAHVHPPGARFHFLTEGSVYGRFLDGLTQESVSMFHRGLERLIDILDAAACIRLHPLGPILEMEGFAERLRVELELVHEERERTNLHLEPESVFAPRGHFRLSTPYQRQLCIMAGTVRNQLFGVEFLPGDDLPPDPRSLLAEARSMFARHWDKVLFRAVEMTDWYLAFNRARRAFESRYAASLGIGSYFPASLTSKPGKLCFRSTGAMNGVLPHLGVPVWNGSGRHYRPPIIRPLWQHLEDAGTRDLRAVRPTVWPEGVFFWGSG